MKKYALPLDLKDDAELIAEYEELHKRIYPEINKSITDAGILRKEIFRVSNRLFMLMETTEDFSFSQKNRWMKKVKRYSNGKSLCGNSNSPYYGQPTEKNGY